jgi:hypothetical protein
VNRQWYHYDRKQLQFLLDIAAKFPNTHIVVKTAAGVELDGEPLTKGGHRVYGVKAMDLYEQEGSFYARRFLGQLGSFGIVQEKGYFPISHKGVNLRLYVL